MSKYNYISHNDAFLKVERYTLDEGKGAGVQMIRVANVHGLEFHVAAGRCMDITELRYRGIPLNYFSGTGITHSAYYDARDEEWLRSFYGGFLTTCGLDQVGEPCEYCGKHYGMHGRIANCPAEHISTDVVDNGGILCGSISGIVRQAMHQGENILLRREFLFDSEKAAFTLNDEIMNLGGIEVPFMILYHFNFGYPFLNENTRIKLPICDTVGWNENSEKRKAEYDKFYPPVNNETGLTLLHEVQSDDHGCVSIDIANNGVQLRMIYNINELPILGQWKLLRTNDYVMGIEPCNNHIKGVAWEADNNSLVYLKPGDRKNISIRVEIRKDDDWC